jgi:PTS system mannose-specific IIC component
VTLETQLALLVWGTLVGLDLVSVPQIMLARPLVAGTIAGALLGDAGAGLLIGTLFELFQLDILPVGAARYPEYGPASVAAVSAAHAIPGVLGFGIGTLVGLVTGLLGGVSIHAARRLTGRAVRAAAARLDAGDVAALVGLHAQAVVRDAARAALVTACGLALAWSARAALAAAVAPRGAALLGVAAVAGGLAAGASGTVRLVGRGPVLRWFALGLGGGAVMAWLR